MKSLEIVLLAGCLCANSWGTPLVLANNSKVADIDSYSHDAQNRSDRSTEQAATPGVSDSASPANESGRVSGLFWKWFRMGERIQADEPDWLSPLATTSGRLKNEFRYDVFQQPMSPRGSQYNFGGGKGLEFIVAPHIQLLVGPPPYVAHMGTTAPDGYADIPVMVKVQLMSVGPREGNYLLTFFLSATVPGGSTSMRDPVLSPTIAFGKGWGNFDVQSTFGENLPAGDTAALGRQLVENTAFQYRVLRRFWPAVEVNSQFFVAGKDAGETQVFLTPELGFGRIRLWRALKFSAAAGMQIAATQFHTYNHRAVVSVRYSF